MGISALTPPTRSEDIVETLLEFPDNRLLIDLCGEYDRNLAQIEHQMGVNILRRGNRLAVIGDKSSARSGRCGHSIALCAAGGGHVGCRPAILTVPSGMGRPMPDRELAGTEQIEMFFRRGTNCAPARSRSNPGPRRKRPMSPICSTMILALASALRAPAKPIWPWPSG